MQDLKYAFRMFRTNPSFTAIAVLSLALGIGANATIFSIARAVVMRSVPVQDPGSLVSLNGAGKKGDNEFSYPGYKQLRDGTSQVFSGVSAYCILAPFSMNGTGEPERIWGQLVSGNYFDVLGVPAAKGRTFLPEEDTVPNRNPVVVISDNLWRKRFGSDPNITGKNVVLNNHTFTVVGVAPQGFRGTQLAVVPELWMPIMMQSVATAGDNSLTEPGSYWLEVTARLRPGVSRSQAQAAVNVFARSHEEVFGKDPGQGAILVRPITSLSPSMQGMVTGFVAILMVVVGLVLMIACANVANLLLSRASARHKEIGVRLALGASRSRLVRQLLTESVLLSVAGGIGGLLIAIWASEGISKFRLPIPIPLDFQVQVDWKVALFTALLAVITGIVFGLSPALHATRATVQSAMREELPAGRAKRFGLRNVLVVSQVSVSLLLLIGTGLFLRSLQNAHSVNIGFEPNGLLSFGVAPKLHNYSEEKTRQFFGRLTEDLRRLPGVTNVSTTSVVPLSIAGSATIVSSTANAPMPPISDVYTVSRGFFETMRIPILRGRDFSGLGSTKEAKVVVVNESLAARLWPGQDPIGKILYNGSRPSEVIGVVRDSKSRTLGEGRKLIFYQSQEQNFNISDARFGTHVVLRASNPARLAPAIREVVRQLDPNLAVFDVEDMNQHLKNALFLPRLAATLFGVFGMVGLLLATIGLYGVMSYAVARRTHEIGIRMAIGADARDVLGMVLKQGMGLTAVGIGVGVALSVILTRFATSLLYGVSPLDWVTFVAIPVLLATVALLATWIPARRAVRVDPIAALRYQ